jgi:hypothetical protein
MSDGMRQLIHSVGSELSLFKEQTSAEFIHVNSEFARLIERMDSEFARIDGRLASHDEGLRAVRIEQARARGDIEWLKENMLTRGEFQTSMSFLLGRFDAFLAKWDDTRYHLAKHGEQLVDHAGRLSRLEKESSS